ncbi:hypothetical protein [Antrihabitans sp. YC2-6]|uniref:hypothetical protein n=1 Tax=Antrihabitans sp. YC2-6 TaxID=2799498 RepID=UPI0018F47858|nr:hypothetical protein [Antrihabitans sp. YC2-6]MBJ8348839.1 hypothetical protein [Antrihabitans sp. YC2-6]
MTTPMVLLWNAQQLLDGTLPTGQPPARLSAFLARQALEMMITQRCQELGAEIPYATTNSKLVVLRALADDEIADAASTAWSGLSNACHHHAYELSPTVGEVRHLCELVAALV